MCGSFRVVIPSAVLLFLACNTAEPPVVEDPAKPATLAEIEARILADPSDPNGYAARALYYEGLDSARLAENDWKRTIEVDSTNARWRIALGELYLRKIDLPHAEQQFGHAIRLAPDSTEGRSKLSEVYLMQLRFKEAMVLANEALRLDPLDAKLYNLKGWIHRTAGDTDLAISSYHTAVERDPSYYDAYISLGMLYAARHDPLAIQFYSSAIDIRPRSVEALYDQAIFLQEHGNDSLALVRYARIKEIEPRYPVAYYNTGYILLDHMGKPAEARAEFNKAIHQLPDYAQAYYSRGLTYETQGMLDSARWDFSQALKLDPGFADAAKGMSRLEEKGVKVSAR